MTIELAALLIALGLLASFMSGLLGIGGGLIVVPLLLYVPGWLGLLPIDVKTSSAVSVALVTTATASGTLANVRRNLVQRRLAAFIISSMVVGGLVGGVLSQAVPDDVMLVAYAVLATLGAVSMALPSGRPDPLADSSRFRPAVAVATGLVVGVVIGLGGAGAFLLLPALVFLLHQPTRVAMATSLAAGFPTALAGVIGKAISGQLPVFFAVLVCVPAIPGAQLGTWVSARLSGAVLRRIYALVVMTVALGFWYDVFHHS